MSRNIQTVTKWLPIDTKGSEIFQECKNLRKTSLVLLIRIETVLECFKKKYSMKMHHSCMQNELNIQVIFYKGSRIVINSFLGVRRRELDHGCDGQQFQHSFAKA